MSLFKVLHDKKNPYTVVNHTIANDSRLSYKAIGIWFYAFSKPEDWHFYFEDLAKRHKDGPDSVRSGIKELEECGYLYRFTKINETTKKFEGCEWIFFETPKTKEEIKKMFPKSGFSPLRNSPTSENPRLLSKEEQSNEKRNYYYYPEKPASSSSPPAPVVVVSSLKKLEIPDCLREQISTEYPEPEIDIAVERTLKWKTRSSDEAAILTTLKRAADWNDDPSEEEVQESNQEYLEKLKSLDEKTFGVTRVVVGHRYIEFVRGIVCERFEIDDKNFKKKVFECLEKIGCSKILDD